MEDSFLLFLIVLGSFFIVLLLLGAFGTFMNISQQRIREEQRQTHTNSRWVTSDDSMRLLQRELSTDHPPEYALRHFRVYDLGLLIYTDQSQVYLLRNFYFQSAVHFVRPVIEIGLFRTETTRVEFQISDMVDRIVAYDTVEVTFPGKKLIFAPNYLPIEKFQNLGTQDFKLQILIYGMVLVEYPFTLSGVTVADVQPKQLHQFYDGELTGAVVAFFQKNIMDEVSIEELLGS